MQNFTLCYELFREDGTLPYYTSHGCYPYYYVLDGRRPICATCANEILAEHAEDSLEFFKDRYHELLDDCEGDPDELDQFQRDYVDVYSDPLYSLTHVDTHLEGVIYCDECSDRIESAYGCAGEDPYCQDDCCNS